MPAQPARRLPPGIIDIAAPQFPLERPHVDPQPAEQEPVASPSARPVTRALTGLERALVRYLKVKVGFHYGADHFVRRHGSAAILAALCDGVMVWDDHYEGWDARRQQPIGGAIGWTANPRLRSPAAYLNKILNGP